LALIDTHVWAWILTDHAALTGAVKTEVIGQDEHVISPISFYEISQKVRIGKWPVMAPFADNLPVYAEKTGLTVVPVGSEVAQLAGSLDWPHRDPFDRIIAATALVNGWPLISADPAFDSLIGLRRIW
jgi:PIN domain nuclease of toxin-antitoxin system